MESVIKGTLIRGTMRNADLIPVFLAEFERIDPNGHAEYLAGLSNYGINGNILLDLDDCDEFWSSMDAVEIVQELFDSLDEHAPDGYYFGAHCGDGSDFGFWKNEE